MIEQIENNEDSKKDTNTKQTETLVTRVTSLAQEDAKAGIKTALPNADEMVARASASLMQKRMQLYQIAGQLSKKAMLRVLAAASDIPQEGLPVLLKTENEKICYMLMQRIQSDKFIIIQNEIVKEVKRLKQEQQEGEQNGQV